MSQGRVGVAVVRAVSQILGQRGERLAWAEEPVELEAWLLEVHPALNRLAHPDRLQNRARYLAQDILDHLAPPYSPYDPRGWRRGVSLGRALRTIRREVTRHQFPGSSLTLRRTARDTISVHWELPPGQAPAQAFLTAALGMGIGTLELWGIFTELRSWQVRDRTLSACLVCTNRTPFKLRALRPGLLLASRKQALHFLRNNGQHHEQLTSALIQQREALRAVLDGASDAIFVVRDGSVVFVNQEGKSLQERLPESCLPPDMQPKSGDMMEGEDKAGEPYTLRWKSSRKLQLDEGQATQYTVESLTARRRLEVDYLDSTDAARRRISQDLHDGLGAYLTALAFQAQKLLGAAGTDASQLDRAQRIAGFAAACQRTGSLLYRGLQSEIRDASDLSSGLEDLVRQWDHDPQRTIRFTPEASPSWMEPTTYRLLFRIAGHLIAEAVDCTDWTRLDLTLEAQGLRLEDNRPATKPTTKGTRWAPIRRDAQRLGAKLQVRPHAGGRQLRVTMEAEERRWGNSPDGQPQPDMKGY